jgi:hypothetical protein
MKRRKNYPGSIEKRGDSYRVILYAGGERHMYTLPGASRADAEQFSRKKHDDLREHIGRIALGIPGSVPLRLVVARYREEKLPELARSSQANYDETLRLFERFLSARTLSLDVREFRRGHAKNFLGWAAINPLSGKGPSSNRTIEKHRAVLHALFGWAEEREFVDHNPVRKVKRPKYDQRDPAILTDDQFDRFLSQWPA